MELEPRQLYEFELNNTVGSLGLFHPYDIDIEITAHLKVSIGRFSLPVLPRLRMLPRKNHPCTVTIGSFCEAGEGSSILAGGEHANSSLFNYSLGKGCEQFNVFMSDEAREQTIAEPEGIAIGDNVLISQGASILDGSRIGTGSVIAAGAVVVGDLPVNGVYGGVPARRLKDRLTCQQLAPYSNLKLPFVRSHCLPVLPALIRQHEAGLISFSDVLGKVEHMPCRPRIALQGIFTPERSIALGPVTGFFVGNSPVTDTSAVGQLSAYFNQFYEKRPKIRWSPDIFHALGLS